MSQVILASGSPRRKELLEQIGMEFKIWQATGEEKVTSSVPEEVVLELSRQKAEEVGAGVLTYNETHRELVTPQDILVIGADTIVAADHRILGKPKDEEDAAAMLRSLSGKTHSVYTGVTFVFIDQNGRTGEYAFYDRTEVEFYELTEEEIRSYVRTGDCMDKAGSYAIQGQSAIFIRGIRGDYNNVVGLPVARVYQELKRIGFEW